MLSVLEYAFKAGLAKGNESVDAKVELSTENGRISFQIRMNHSANFEVLPGEEDKLRRQLSLSYSDKYSFEVRHEEGQLSFHLILDILS